MMFMPYGFDLTGSEQDKIAVHFFLIIWKFGDNEVGKM